MIAPVQATYQDDFEDQADNAGGDHRDRNRDPERAGRLRHARRDVRADHVERAVRQIQHVHDAEHQRQPGRDQEQHQSELQAVEQLLDEESGHPDAIMDGPDAVRRGCTRDAAGS